MIRKSDLLPKIRKDFHSCQSISQLQVKMKKVSMKINTDNSPMGRSGLWHF
jgi:hypothetical protein